MQEKYEEEITELKHQIQSGTKLIAITLLIDFRVTCCSKIVWLSLCTHTYLIKYFDPFWVLAGTRGFCK